MTGRSADPARRRLAAAQTELIGALLAGGPPPDGFDEGRLRIEAKALLNKRRRVTARLRPDVAEQLDERFPQLFGVWAVDHPRRADVTARADADAFAAWLVRNGQLPPPRPPWWRPWRRWRRRQPDVRAGRRPAR